MLGVPDTEPVSDNFDELGFESKYMLNNMGTMIIFYLIYPMAIYLSSMSSSVWFANRRERQVVSSGSRNTART